MTYEATAGIYTMEYWSHSFSRLERFQKQHNLRAQKQQKQSSFTSCRLQDALDYRLALHRVPSTLCEFLLDRSVSLYPFSSFTSSGADCSSFFQTHRYLKQQLCYVDTRWCSTCLFFVAFASATILSILLH